MTTPTIHKQVSLQYQQDGCDERYHIFIEDASYGGSYNVRVECYESDYSTTREYYIRGVTWSTAMNHLYILKLAKESRGYREYTPSDKLDNAAINDSSVESKPSREYTELKPQLLKPITIDEIETYITDDNWLVQEKLDGKRIMIEVNFGKITASNRNSWKVNIPQDIEAELSKFDDCILDGELVNGVYYVFDCLSYNNQDIRSIPYWKRFHILVESVIGDRMLYQLGIVPTAFSKNDKRELVASLQHKEGVVFKNLDALYSVGRSDSQLKCKFWSSATCVVSSINEKRSVAVSVDSLNGFVPVGNVTVPPNYELPQSGDYVEIKYLYYHPGGALYQPQYLGIRDDVNIDMLESLKPKSQDVDK